MDRREFVGATIDRDDDLGTGSRKPRARQCWAAATLAIVWGLAAVGCGRSEVPVHPGGESCGNGVVDEREACDDGNDISGDGCEPDCTRTCEPGAAGEAVCDDGNVCNGVEICGEDFRCAPGPLPEAGTACGEGRVCLLGQCVEDRCGDLVVTEPEECDDGNDIDGDGCDRCLWSCVPGDPARGCAPDDVCQGPSVCDEASHVCGARTPLADGTECGEGRLCLAAECVPGLCGDGFVSGSEECDLAGGNGPGTGCEADCRFSCTMQPDSCSDGNPCNGVETCQSVVVDGRSGQLCEAGVPAADGAPCGAGMHCVAGACVQAVCGDGIVSGGEECDFAGGNGPGTGCEADCRFSCSSAPDSCSDGNPCNGVEVCQTVRQGDSVGQACVAATPPAEGYACGVGMHCAGGACVTAYCGDGITSGGEECDFGAGNGPGAGCETNCRFSCSTTSGSCSDGNPCNGVEACLAVTVDGKVGQRCQPGAVPAQCAACGSGGFCQGGLCKASTCGDGCLDTGAGEQCEPPGTAACGSDCRKQAICGDGVRGPGEQCDDGNTRNLDGCDQDCQFEQIHRINSLMMQSGTSALCPANALGNAITSFAMPTFQTTLNQGIQNGSLSMLLQFLGLGDLSGQTAPAFLVGGLTGTPVGPQSGQTYDGTADLDWWYQPHLVGLDAQRLPLAQIPGSLTAGRLSVGPGSLTVMLNLGSGPQGLTLSGARASAQVGPTNAPLASTGSSPGHLASERLDPALRTFASMGNGEICGNLSAFALSMIPIPATLQMDGDTPCNQNYTASNSMLDVFVGGCSFLFLPLIVARQPDQDDPTVPPVGSGPEYQLTVNSQKVVTGCRDRNGSSVSLDACLRDAAYSSYFKFTTGRVIAK